MNRLVPLVMILLVFSTVPVFAHNLISYNPENLRTNTPLMIENPTEESFTLERISRVGESHFYSFYAFAGEELFFEVRVPKEDNQSAFRPSFDILMGDSKMTAMPVSETFVEELTGTEWRVTAKMVFIPQVDGTYTIRVHDELGHYEIGDTGKFSFVVGKTDHRLSLFDLLESPLVIFGITWFFEDYRTVVIWIMLILLFVILISYLIDRKMRK